VLKDLARTAISYAMGARKKAHALFPGVLGHQIRGSLVQLYRNDAQFETHVSLVNYLSFYGADRSTRIRYTLTVYDRHGNRIVSTRHVVGPEQTIQANLQTLSGKPLDEFGVFTVDASYDPHYTRDLAFLGETSPQFMTFFIPRDGKSAPQMIHSHKRLQRLPAVRQKIGRTSRFAENLDDLAEFAVYALNSSPSALAARIELRDGETGAQWRSFDLDVRGHGVGRVVLPDLSGAPRKMSMFYEVNRRIDHRKPILFRKTKSGFVSCNHS
jgi:hypothetical protein